MENIFTEYKIIGHADDSNDSSQSRDTSNINPNICPYCGSEDVSNIGDYEHKERKVADWDNQPKQDKIIYMVIILLVFGGVEKIYAFSSEEEANSFIVRWANDNSENEFKNAYDALEWFRLHDDKLDYVIQLIKTKIKG